MPSEAARASLPAAFRTVDFSSVRKLIKSGADESHYSPATGRPPTGKLSGYFQRRAAGRAADSSVGVVVEQRQQPAPVVLPGDVCPSCLMPFDANRKRRLIDSCGHERCYACLFSNEPCPLCSVPGHPGGKRTSNEPHQQNGRLSLLKSRTVGSSHELNHHAECDSVRVNNQRQQQQQQQQSPRSKVKTNGHLIAYMQHAGKQACLNSVVTGLPPAPSPASQRATAASDSSSPFGRRKPMPTPTTTTTTTTNARAARPACTSRRANRLAGSSPSPVRSGANGRDSRARRASPSPSVGSEMMSRLGLLFGADARNERSPSSGRGSATLASARSHDSSSSMKSLDQNRPGSSNVSPVSTLTGSSEAEMQAHAMREMNDHSSDSLGSSLSMSLGGRSASVSPGPCFTSSRRHSLSNGQNDADQPFGKRQALIRRSARTGTVLGPIDPKIRFAQFRAPILALKPLFFQVPQQDEPDAQFFWGRPWVFRELGAHLLAGQAETTRRGVVISGATGTGKTWLALQLVEYSCFGRSRVPILAASRTNEPVYESPYGGAESVYSRSGPPVSEAIQSLAARVVAYHFCQAENSSTCLVPDFVHSLAAQLCQAPQLMAYRQLLLADPHLQALLSLKECVANPHEAFVNGILEPLASVKRDEATTCVIVIDALCEAEYHRPDYGDTLAGFITRHALQFPHWLKVIVTVRAPMHAITQHLPYATLSLDPSPANESVNRDLVDYITHRVNSDATIKSNVAMAGVKSVGAPSDAYGSASAGGPTAAMQTARFAAHLSALSRGNYLHAKMTLDLIASGHLVTKSSSFKVLPISMSEIFLLHFNLRFSSRSAFERVEPILNVCLASLNPMSLLEMYHSVNALLDAEPLAWEEFVQRVKLLAGLVVQRSDDTHMLLHPSLREWLVRRDDAESAKFVCDPRAGHAAIALRLSRLEAPLDAEKTMELGHHILKAHLYKNSAAETPVAARHLQAVWVALSADDVSGSLGSLRHLYSPNVKVSRLLLLAGASPDHITEVRGNSPLLCLYAEEGLVEMVSLLLEFGASRNATTNSGVSALCLASERGHCDVVRMLVQRGASLSQTDHGGSCALLYAAQMGHLNVVGYLLSCDWPSDHLGTGELGLAEAAQQALIVAAGQGHAHVLEFLLDMAEVRVNLPDTLRGHTALTAACTAGHRDVCRILVRRGANVGVTNLSDASPLMCAVQEGHWQVAEWLLQEAGASVDQADANGRTALTVAASEGHVGLLELLLANGADVENADKDGLTALSWACLHGHRHAVVALLEKGANVNATDKHGRTALDHAATRPDPKLIQILLDKGAVLEHVDLQGMRPLDRAISCRNTPVVQAVLRRGAKLGPATWALAAGKHDIILVLMGKLLDDGNTLYKKQRLHESTQRFQYALKKFPPADDYGGAEYRAAFEQLKVHLSLNLARCRRKLGDMDEAVTIASQVLHSRPDSFEALYVRAKARRDLGLVDEALSDLNEAVKLAPADVMRVLKRAIDEIQSRNSTTVAATCRNAISPAKQP